MVAVINSWLIKTTDTHKTPLLRKASKTFLITSIILLILSGIVLFTYTKQLLNSEIEEELFSNKDRVEHFLEQNPDLKGIPPIMTAEKTEKSQKNILVDTLIYDPSQDEIELFRQLSGTKTINGQQYKITVRAMVIESEDILFGIVFTFMAVIFIAFILLFYFNKFRNEKLWQPFFVNLDKIKKFSLKSNEDLHLKDSEILEFHELNSELKILTNKIQVDYHNLKQFTEDVSHEMQTPLAIMQAKIETIINDSHINEDQFNQFTSIQADISRLKQLNKKLILLSKIDNNQFSSSEMVSINDVVEKTLANFKELASIEILQETHANLSVEMDKSLAIVLCNNLISNSVKHNKGDNAIMVIIEAHTFQVINSGDKALAHPDRIFERFYKESKKPDSTGLGLSIVKKICDHYGFIPSYRFRESEKQHIFQIDFTTVS